MREAIVLEEQKGLWIEERLLRQAQLGERLQVMVRAGEIRILPAVTVSPRFPYGVTADEAKMVLREVREEAIALYGGQAPPADQPYFGGMTWREYQTLPDEERRALWDRLYAEFDVEIEAIELKSCITGATSSVGHGGGERGRSLVRMLKCWPWAPSEPTRPARFWAFRLS